MGYSTKYITPFRGIVENKKKFSFDFNIKIFKAIIKNKFSKRIAYTRNRRFFEKVDFARYRLIKQISDVGCDRSTKKRVEIEFLLLSSDIRI